MSDKLTKAQQAIRRRWSAAIDKAFHLRHRIPPRHRAPYSTHLPVLLGLRKLITIYRILELGAGRFSTPMFLDRSLFPDLTRLVSLENDGQWHSEVQRMVGSDTRFQLELTSGTIADAVKNATLSEYDLVFIDDSADMEGRSATIIAVANRATPKTIAVVHDFEVSKYRSAASSFRHSFLFSAFCPCMGVLWNSLELKKSALHQLNDILKAHASNVSPDDVQSWQHILESSLCVR